MDEAQRLRGFGYQVDVVHRGEDAVERVADGGIDLILMDIDLGTGMDGRETAQAILRRRSLPIVFLTSHAEEEVVARVRSITRYGYVLKSSGDFVLKSSIEMAFELFQAHAALQRSEARYRGFFEQSPIAVWEEDLSAAKRKLDQLSETGVGDVAQYLQEHPELLAELTDSVQVLDVNQRAVEMYGANKREELLRGISQLFPEESLFSMIPEFVALSDRRTRFSMEKLHLTLRGQRMHVQVHWAIAPGHEEEYDRVLVSIADVSELRRSEADLAASLDSIADGVITTDVSGRVRRMNPTAEELTGWNAGDAIGQAVQKCFVIVDSVSREAVPDPVEQVLRTGELVSLGNHTALIRPDGSERQIADAASPIRVHGGMIQGAVLVFRDVTESYARRERIRRSERQLARAQRLASMGSWEFDFNKNVVTASEEAHRIYGLEPGTFSIERAQAVPLPEYREMLDAALRDLMQNQHPYGVEFRIQRVSDGAIRDIHSLAEYDAEQNRVIGVIRDVTEEREVQRELQQESTRLRAVLQSGNLAWWECDLEADSLTFSDSLASMLGYSADSIRDIRDFTRLVHADDRAALDAAMREYLSGERDSYDLEYRVRAADGTYGWIHDTGRITARAADGAPKTVTGILRNVDPQRRTEA